MFTNSVEELVSNTEKKVLSLSSINEAVNTCTSLGAKVIKVGLPKNGHDVFSLWCKNQKGRNRIVIIKNKEWDSFSPKEQTLIKNSIEKILT
jgi:hypothetical protein